MTARIESLVKSNIQPPWNTVSTGVGFQNSWTTFNASFEDAQFMKDTLGFVHVRGIIKDGTSGTTAFTLPVGYRALKTMEIPAITIAGVVGFTYIYANGDVVPNTADFSVTSYSFGEIVFSTL
jgi:hypothetical protein